MPKLINGHQFAPGDVLADLVLRQHVSPEKLNLCLQAGITALVAAELPTSGASEVTRGVEDTTKASRSSGGKPAAKGAAQREQADGG